MTLIRSISGIRGTIGGTPGTGLTPLDTVRYTAAFGTFIRKQSGKERPRMVLGRDARISGPMMRDLVSGTLVGLGFEVVDLDMATTPTVEIAVTGEQADGGIILTASHNPAQWNALKLLNGKGEFISAEDGEEVLRIAAENDYEFVPVEKLGSVIPRTGWTRKHIDMILALDLVDVDAIKKAKLRVALDAVNSVGGSAVPALLGALGVLEVIQIYCTPNGIFPHNPEPLPENLVDLCTTVVKHKAHVGFAVDPDVDRLAMVCEDGTLFGEEYTLVACADHVLAHRKGDTVSNLSSTRALNDIAEKHQRKRHASAVGEVNVVELMKKIDAPIGGEGNGGVILSELHYGRDALVGIAIFLTLLAKSGKSCSDLRKSYPNYFISKNKIQLEPNMDVQAIVDAMQVRHSAQPHSMVDGLRIEFDNTWVHLRKSNTEPIIRVYAEAPSMEQADQLAQRILHEVAQVAGIPETVR
ncbi:MAG: phosphoglucosamine mutase [Flavobacteriales bacterium]|nr:phosphoglucosamine mutase [Flavobacteriales bacterium]MBK7241457.1 phosphoglucosamine mutase [Flavobacteriales bacterium]MBK9535098.1 phosphoglucosamine mutase [Flavobacteriales bacterium]MBP9139496.1 phosphoglucosamine mutase [Flavobacteriales bacterium]HQV52946.1 phosphoglucosamine mutase [Flavobacteriales bacterium]